MTVTRAKLLPWSLWGAQLRAILRLELGKSFFGRRSWWIYLAIMAPVFLTGGHSIATMTNVLPAHALSTDIHAFSGIFHFGYLRVFLFFGCAILFTNLFRGEVYNRTLHYYFLAPVRREVLAVGKYAAGLLAACVLYGVSVVLCHVATFFHHGPQFQQFYLRDGGLGHLAAYAGVTVLACVGYGAVFTVMGLLFRNPMIPAAIVLVWEGINGFLPPLLKKVSVIFYLTSLLPVEVRENAGPVASLLTQAADPVPAWLAVPGLLLLSVAAMVYAAVLVRRFEVSYSE